MTEYHTDSFSTISKINTLKSSCKAIGLDIGRQTITVITDFETVTGVLEILASKLFQIADLARKTESLWNGVIENRHSVWNAMIALRINADVNSYLDRLEKEVDQKLKREYDKYKDEIKRHCY